MDDIERDDLGYSDTSMTAEDWARPLREVKRSPVWRLDDEPEEQEDDWGDGSPEEEPWDGED